MKLAALRGNWRPQGGSGHTARAAAAALVVSLLLSLACCEDAASGAPAPAPASGLPWALLFSDEFDSPGGLDYGKWTPMIGQGYEYGLPGFANGELQYYTSKPENLRLENGMIVIQVGRRLVCMQREAQRSWPACSWLRAGFATRRSPPALRCAPFALPAQAQQSDPGNPYSATSARISTLDKFSVSPSAEYPTIRLEARMKVPQGAPATDLDRGFPPHHPSPAPSPLPSVGVL